MSRATSAQRPPRADDASREDGPDAAPTPQAQARPPVVHSTALMAGHRAIEIDHHGVLYRLQATRLGKLILTK